MCIGYIKIFCQLKHSSSIRCIKYEVLAIRHLLLLWSHLNESKLVLIGFIVCERNSFQAPIVTVSQGLNALRRVLMCTLSKLDTLNGKK